MASAFDVVVIGAGTGGYVAAIRAAQLGLTTAVVERETVLGGTCLNWGCIPTKALLEHAHAYKVAKAARDWGITLGEAATVGLDMNVVQDRKDKIVKGLTGGIGLLFKKNKIEWIKGSARLLGKGAIEVTDAAGAASQITAGKEIIVATGSSPRSVPGIAFDYTRIITSTEAMNLREVPRSIDRDGQRRGRRRVRVDLQQLRHDRRHRHRVAAAHRAQRGRGGVGDAREELPEEEDSRADRHESDSAPPTRATPSRVTAELSDGKVETLSAEYLLVATGRGPVTDGLGAETSAS